MQAGGDIWVKSRVARGLVQEEFTTEFKFTMKLNSDPEFEFAFSRQNYRNESREVAYDDNNNNA